jgi:broad specificity phosphatase PhoE
MAHQLKKRLRGLNFTRCYASPLGRAMQTAAILTEGTGIVPEPEIRIREVNLGEAEGLIMEELPPDELYAFYHEPQNFHPKGGEGYEAAFQRVSGLMRELETEDGCVLLVAHALILRLIRLYLLNLPITEMMKVHTAGCCFCEAHYTGGKWDLKSFADDRCQASDYDPEHYAYFGSPVPVEAIPGEAVLTPYSELAAAYAHDPQHVSVSLNGIVTHDGTAEGLLYRVDLSDRSITLLGPAPAMRTDGDFYL